MRNSEGIVYARVLKAQIAEITRIMEGYEHIALVSTINPKEGIIKLFGTPDTADDIMLILANLPFEVEILRNFKECE